MDLDLGFLIEGAHALQYLTNMQSCSCSTDIACVVHCQMNLLQQKLGDVIVVWAWCL